MAAGQTSPVPPASPGPQITLNVVVLDKSGKPVTGLGEQDFTVLDDKQPRKISAFQAMQGSTAGPPVEILLLLDEANTGYSGVAVARIQIEKFLKENGGELPRPVTLAFFSDSGLALGETSSQDGNKLAATVDQHGSGLRVIGRSQGFYGAGDRLTLSLNALRELITEESTHPGRKVVVWISPGWPLLSGPNVQLTQKNEQGIFNSIVTISEGLRRANIALYDVDPLGTTDAGGYLMVNYPQFLKGVKKPGQAQIGNLALQVFAEHSGGRVLNASNDVAGLVAKCIADTNAYYELSYDAAAGDGSDVYHSIEVKLDQPHLTAHTLTGYYAAQ